VIASIVELVLALAALATAGHILIRLVDRQREAGRRDR
jgi:hypothetical protein